MATEFPDNLCCNNWSICTGLLLFEKNIYRKNGKYVYLEVYRQKKPSLILSCRHKQSQQLMLPTYLKQTLKEMIKYSYLGMFTISNFPENWAWKPQRQAQLHEMHEIDHKLFETMPGISNKIRQQAPFEMRKKDVMGDRPVVRRT